MKNRKILDQLLELKKADLLHKKFDFSSLNEIRQHYGEYFESIKGIPNCGTLGCLAGNIPQFDSDAYFSETGDLHFRSQMGSLTDRSGLSNKLAKYFDIPQAITSKMFLPGINAYECNSNAKLEEVQDNIRAIMADARYSIYFESN